MTLRVLINLDLSQYHYLNVKVKNLHPIRTRLDNKKEEEKGEQEEDDDDDDDEEEEDEEENGGVRFLSSNFMLFYSLSFLLLISCVLVAHWLANYVTCCGVFWA